MTRFVRLALIALAGATLAVGVAGSSPAQAKSLKQQIVGTWAYVSVEMVKGDGSHVQTFGDKPSGIAIFGRDGHFALVVTRSDLPKYASKNRMTATAEEYQATVRGSLAQFGTYTVNDADHSVMLHVVGASYPNIIGVDRKFIIASVTKNELKWTVPTATSGGTVNTVLQRAK